MRRYMVTVRTIDGTKVESFTDYRDAVEYANEMKRKAEGVITIKDNMTNKVYPIG